MEIYLIRHGECQYLAKDYNDLEKHTINPPLTAKGEEQAHQLANRLGQVFFNKIYASDLVRAVQTAAILNSALHTDVVITPNLREIDLGELLAKSWDDFPDIYAKWNLHEEDVPYTGGENGSDVWKRCKTEIDAIIEKDYERVAIVCHGGAIRAMICGMLGLPQSRRHFFGNPLQNCSVSVIVHNNEGFYLQSFND